MSPLLWALLPVGIVAALAAVVAGFLTLGRMGGVLGLLASHIGRTLRQMGFNFVRVIGGTAVAALLLPVALYRLASQGRQAAHKVVLSAGAEAQDAGLALFRFAIVGPLTLVGLGGAISHVARRLPDALGAPRTSRADFEGYKVLRELRAGGSGARIFVCEPDARTRVRIGLPVGEVVIKSFDFDDGTGLAEMLRESRALESARRLGLILDHSSTERRFHYTMRYYAGLDLGKYTRRLHEHAQDGELDRAQHLHLAALMHDLVATLRDWHGLGLWHKDVKPENIIVHEGRATLIDLSLVTPLASQMTLTTHGTEYFRDPEMVRQALRGARVSDVDAARFDLYGAGAVLHFMLEGTFPAHGVLSGFRKKSPECLRWIARRAMADFDRRYTSAEEMLRDLDQAMLGGDPWAVRPADLPSMRGREPDARAAGTPDVPEADASEPVHSEPVVSEPVVSEPVVSELVVSELVVSGADASTQAPSPATTTTNAALDGRRIPPPQAPTPASMQAASRRRDTRPATAPPDATARVRPVFRVTNWWTGAYEMSSARPAPASIPAQSKRSILPPLAVLIASLVALGIFIALVASSWNGTLH